jgi:thermolabile hemolysin
VLQNKTYYPPRPPGSDDERKLELARRLSQLSNYHNQQLRDVVKDLERQFPDSDILLEDSALAINQLLQQESPVDFGFSLEQHQQTLVHDGQKATIQQRCYSGGYLGSTNPEEVCSEQENALFWDVIHPTTYAHCWEAWFIGRTLASAQWIAPMPEQAQYRQWCELVSSRQNGHRETAWRLSGL